jgi:hypothetical protein
MREAAAAGGIPGMTNTAVSEGRRLLNEYAQRFLVEGGGASRISNADKAALKVHIDLWFRVIFHLSFRLKRTHFCLTVRLTDIPVRIAVCP